MSGINIFMNKKQNAPQRTPFGTSTPFDHRNGFFGAVTEVHPETNTVHVVTDTGIELMNVEVASQQWVTYKKDGKPRLTGERNLPPVGTYVYCVMPNGTYDDCFVLCSMFSTASIHKDYMADDEDTANTKLCQENGGWLKTTDIRTGTKVIKNKPEDETIKIEIDQEKEGEEKATITVHGNVISITKDEGLKIETDQKVVINDKSGFEYSTEGDLKIGADGKVEVKSNKSGTLEIGNSVATMGAMISDLLGYLASLKTVGSPATHSASPDFVAQIQALKTKWGQVFK